MLNLQLSGLQPASLFLACLALGACGGGSSAPATSGPGSPVCGEGSNIAGQIVGNWKRQCRDSGAGSYEIDIRSFRDDGTYTITTRDYSDSNCTNSTGFSFTNAGSYTLGPAITTSGGLPANEIDIEIVPLAGGGTNTIYDIVRFDNASGRLYLSEFGAFRPQDRPDTLDLVAYHVCQ